MKEIGQGVAGQVWRGRMNETNWDIAVKVIFGSEDVETGDDAEISFLRQCRHRRLVMFLGNGNISRILQSTKKSDPNKHEHRVRSP